MPSVFNMIALGAVLALIFSRVVYFVAIHEDVSGASAPGKSAGQPVGKPVVGTPSAGRAAAAGGGGAAPPPSGTGTASSGAGLTATGAGTAPVTPNVKRPIQASTGAVRSSPPRPAVRHVSPDTCPAGFPAMEAEVVHRRTQARDKTKVFQYTFETSSEEDPEKKPHLGKMARVLSEPYFPSCMVFVSVVEGDRRLFHQAFFAMETMQDVVTKLTKLIPGGSATHKLRLTKTDQSNYDKETQNTITNSAGDSETLSYHCSRKNYAFFVYGPIPD